MIKTQILLWKTIEDNRRLRVSVMAGVRSLLYVLNFPPLTRDVACYRLCLDGKNMRRQHQINTLQRITFQRFFITPFSQFLKCGDEHFSKMLFENKIFRVVCSFYFTQFTLKFLVKREYFWKKITHKKYNFPQRKTCKTLTVFLSPKNQTLVQSFLYTDRNLCRKNSQFHLK